MSRANESIATPVQSQYAAPSLDWRRNGRGLARIPRQCWPGQSYQRIRIPDSVDETQERKSYASRQDSTIPSGHVFPIPLERRQYSRNHEVIRHSSRKKICKDNDQADQGSLQSQQRLYILPYAIPSPRHFSHTHHSTKCLLEQIPTSPNLTHQCVHDERVATTAVTTNRSQRSTASMEDNVWRTMELDDRR